MSITAGIDIGSVTAKCVIVSGRETLARALIRTGVDPEQAGATVFGEALVQAGLTADKIAAIVSTGYGRRLARQAQSVVTEISAAALGAWTWLGQKPCVVVDVGGQDTKAIEVGADGDVTDFLMNDKCAAGTGRFIEMMAAVLETDLEGFSRLALQSDAPVTVNSTCSVFAESEVVSLIAHAARKEDIAAGLCRAIAGRIAAMLRHFGRADNLVFCGGGAKSAALKKALEEAVGQTLSVPDEPQFTVAHGAALAAGKSVVGSER